MLKSYHVPDVLYLPDHVFNIVNIKNDRVEVVEDTLAKRRVDEQDYEQGKQRAHQQGVDSHVVLSRQHPGQPILVTVYDRRCSHL